MLRGMIAAALVFFLDQASKLYVMENLLNGRGIIMVNDYFNIVSAWNTGVSFSMFDNQGTAGMIALSLVAMGIVAYLLFWLYHERNRLIQISLGFIIGGALGNVLDRIRLGAVFDFLDVHIDGSHWPAFNAADSFICIGAFLIVAQGLWGKKAEVQLKTEEK